MNKLLLLALSFVLLFACKNEKVKQDVPSEAKVEVEIEHKQDWSVFEKMEGTLPEKAGLTTNEELQKRIQKMLGKNYDEFKANWNTETPIVVEDRIIYISGCQKSDCKANRYLLFLDVIDNNINIINFSYGRVRSWEERSIIGLPEGHLKIYEEIRAEQGL